MLKFKTRSSSHMPINKHKLLYNYFFLKFTTMNKEKGDRRVYFTTWKCIFYNYRLLYTKLYTSTSFLTE